MLNDEGLFWGIAFNVTSFFIGGTEIRLNIVELIKCDYLSTDFFF